MVRKTAVLLMAAGVLLFSAACKYGGPAETARSEEASSWASAEAPADTASKAAEEGELQALEKEESGMEQSQVSEEAVNLPAEGASAGSGSGDGLVSSAVQGDSAGEKDEPSFAAGLEAASYAKQIVVVAAEGTSASVSLHEKDEKGVWREIVSAEGFVGSDGVGKASESAARTPKGCYSLTQAFGVQANPGTELPYLQVDDSHYWVDDPYSSYYNRLVSTRDVAKSWNSAEHLVDSAAAYAYAVAIDYNTDCVPGEGSAFFLHCSTGAPTAGCVSVPEEDMICILRHLSEDAYIVIGTAEDF